MEKEDSTEFVKWFSELNKDSIKTAGGKGANLAEIYNLKIQVPQGFVVTTSSYDLFIKNSELKEKITELLNQINYEDTKQLDETTKQIRELITNSEMPNEIQEDIIESYGTLSSEMKNGQTAHDLIRKSFEPSFVAVRSSATTEDLEGASFAGQQDTFLNIKGNSELIEAIKKAFASLFTSRATYYRNKKGFSHDAKLAVVVQKMIDSEKSGVIFSKDPSHNKDNIIIEAVYGLGEGIVSGKITPDKYELSNDLKILDKKISNKKMAITRNSAGQKSETPLTGDKATSQVLKEEEITKLAEIALNLEEHYQKPQDIEFAIESNEIFIVQTRAITTLNKEIKQSDQEIKGDLVLEGLAASPGIASGKIRIIKTMEDLQKINQGDVLVTKMTNPDMVVSMQKASAIVTDEGGLTAHAAIVSREMGIPSVVGTQEATTKLREDEIITVDGFTGKIYKGKVSEAVEKEILPISKNTKTKIKVIVDLPLAAERASKTGIRDIGLLRLEGIIAESGKHPNYFLKQNKMKEYEEIIFNGVKKISENFDSLWVRTSDIRSDEFQNTEGAPEIKEANPMLGMHGIRYSLKNPEILKAELNALKKISEQGKQIGLLLPQVILVEEVQKVKEIVKEMNFLNVKIGVMIETPASVQIIKELIEEGIDFISFGTNDLTQYTLAIDRGNEQVQDIYDEMNPAVLNQLGFIIRVCKRSEVETSICGQAGSKKEMVKFLFEKEIDSISVNPDMAKEISDYIYELESGNNANNNSDNVEVQVPTENSIPVGELQKNEENESKEENENETESEDDDEEIEPEENLINEQSLY